MFELCVGASERDLLSLFICRNAHQNELECRTQIAISSKTPTTWMIAQQLAFAAKTVARPSKANILLPWNRITRVGCSLDLLVLLDVQAQMVCFRLGFGLALVFEHVLVCVSCAIESKAQDLNI